MTFPSSNMRSAVDAGGFFGKNSDVEMGRRSSSSRPTLMHVDICSREATNEGIVLVPG